MGLLRRIVFEVGKAILGIDGDTDTDIDNDVDIDNNHGIDNDFDCETGNTEDSMFLDLDDGGTDDGTLEFDDTSSGQNVSFGHAPNNGSYLNSGKEVYIQVAGGLNKGSYDVFYHNGQKYIDFNSQWINIEGKDRFFLNGNTYIIK